jgi:hypothetical protein
MLADWDKHLEFVTFAYNTALHAATGFSPFFLMYGREPNVPLDLVFDSVLATIESTPGEYSANLEQQCGGPTKRSLRTQPAE